MSSRLQMRETVRTIPVCEPKIGPEELSQAIKCIKSGWISGSGGRYITEFEQRFSAYCDVMHGVAVSNGTAALHLALASLDLSENDEVIIPTFTNIATLLAVAHVGAKPVLADCDSQTLGMDSAAVEKKITKKTVAIIPVHIYGHPVDMDPLLSLAEDYKLTIIEDAAEAHGAKYKGHIVGGIGHIGCFSFYANKIITTGEGGMIVTDNRAIAERAKLLRNMAFSDTVKYRHEYLGFNYRMTNIQAAIGLAQLEKIGELVQAKRNIAHVYDSRLSSLKSITLPVEMPWAMNVYWMYGMLLDSSHGSSRDEFMKKLANRGVDTRAFFYPMHWQPALLRKGWYKDESYPVAENIAERGLYVPSGLTLTRDDIYYVCDAIKDCLESGS